MTDAPTATPKFGQLCQFTIAETGELPAGWVWLSDHKPREPLPEGIALIGLTMYVGEENVAPVRYAIERAHAIENEECALIADSLDPMGHGGVAGAIATAIRARRKAA